MPRERPSETGSDKRGMVAQSTYGTHTSNTHLRATDSKRFYVVKPESPRASNLTRLAKSSLVTSGGATIFILPHISCKSSKFKRQGPSEGLLALATLSTHVMQPGKMSHFHLHVLTHMKGCNLSRGPTSPRRCRQTRQPLVPCSTWKYRHFQFAITTAKISACFTICSLPTSNLCLSASSGRVSSKNASKTPARLSTTTPHQASIDIWAQKQSVKTNTSGSVAMP